MNESLKYLEFRFLVRAGCGFGEEVEVVGEEEGEAVLGGSVKSVEDGVGEALEREGGC